MIKRRRKHIPPRRRAWLSVFALVAFTIFLVELHVFASPVFFEPAPEPQEQVIDFSKFLHTNKNHARLPCLLCHRRLTTSAIPVMPGAGHLPCTGCHAKEFTNRSSPVCDVCHTDAESGALKPFPGLKSFNMMFDHSVHATSVKVSCSTCHRPLRGGEAMSIPAGFSAHNTCYRCHAPRAKAEGRDISSCGVCHEPGGYSRTSTRAAAFRFGFSHAKHDGAQNLSCGQCHTLRAGMSQRRQVTVPFALYHHAPARGRSCASCHTGKRAFGGDDFSTCTKCHKGPEWHF